ncbi:MAG: cation diffusion facilitator family transporter [Proteobacteria bacterium]|nr:cation diffusion facilitator family transporter [Pseudomonadota bacterium]
MSSGHDHALPGASNERSLRWALLFTGGFLLAEVVGGVVLNSLALISDAAHMFTDAAALAIALAAIRIARRPADDRRTFGYHRFEILAAAFNALLLFGVAIYILYEAWQRWQAPAEVQTTGVMVVAAIGLLVNLVSMQLLRGGKDSSLNVKGAYLEVWSDLLGSLGVLVGALVIRLTGWNWVDPLIAVAIGLWVLPRTWILLRDTVNVLLEGVPEGVDVAAIRQSLLAVEGVVGLHDLHVWALTSGKPSLSVHLVHRMERADAGAVLHAIRKVLVERHGITHTTVQIETEPCAQALADSEDPSAIHASAAGEVHTPR